MSSSLELNSDTSMFSPSDTLVSETQSRPEARTWASEGRSRFRPDFITLTRLKEGWRGPRFLFLASFATSITSSQHLAENETEKGVRGLDFKDTPAVKTPCDQLSSVNLRLDQYSQKLSGVSNQQWPLQASSKCWAYCWSICTIEVCWYQPSCLLIREREL